MSSQMYVRICVGFWSATTGCFSSGGSLINQQLSKYAQFYKSEVNETI